MKNIVKIILGVAVIGVVVGGGFMLLNKKEAPSVNFGGQKVVLTNKDKSVTLDLPKVDQLASSPVAVMGSLDLTEEQEAEIQAQREKQMEQAESGESVDETQTDTIEDSVSGENYDEIKDQKIKEISLNLKNNVSARYEISDVVYTKDTLQSISGNDNKDAVKNVKIGDVDFMYTTVKQDIEGQKPYYFYYIVSNKLESNSIFIVLSIQGSEINEKSLTDYMSAVKF